MKSLSAPFSASSRHRHHESSKYTQFNAPLTPTTALISGAHTNANRNPAKSSDEFHHRTEMPPRYFNRIKNSLWFCFFFHSLRLSRSFLFIYLFMTPITLLSLLTVQQFHLRCDIRAEWGCEKGISSDAKRTTTTSLVETWDIEKRKTKQTGKMIAWRWECQK